LTQESQSALAKQQRRGDRSTAAVRNQSSGGNGKESGNAPLLRFEAWGLKADTPYRFHIQAVNGQGRGLWVCPHIFTLSQIVLLNVIVVMCKHDHACVHACSGTRRDDAHIFDTRVRLET
jgi:hypothetical protein